MHRLSNGTQTNTAPVAPEVVGTPGYPTPGDPLTGVQPSELDFYWDYVVAEELCAVIEGAGIALDKAATTQLLDAIRRIGRPQLAIFSASGVIAVPSGRTSFRGRATAGGGGGGGSTNANSAGAGGGGGEVVEFQVTGLVPGAPLAITVGQGGNPGSNTGGDGAAGTATSFGGYATAQPGAGGKGANGAIAGQAGTGGTGGGVANGATGRAFPAEDGGTGYLVGGNGIISGTGGAPGAGGGRTDTTNSSVNVPLNGKAGRATGQGGGGGVAGGSGGRGADGLIIGWWEA